VDQTELGSDPRNGPDADADGVTSMDNIRFHQAFVTSPSTEGPCARDQQIDVFAGIKDCVVALGRRGRRSKVWRAEAPQHGFVTVHVGQERRCIAANDERESGARDTRPVERLADDALKGLGEGGPRFASSRQATPEPMKNGPPRTSRRDAAQGAAAAD